ncbi:hypothetical protein KKF84_18130, partial [Myxococcota bacterium]|nr:hypothetical protein [Myxococcota bacterium]
MAYRLLFVLLLVFNSCSPEGKTYSDTELCDNNIDDDGDGLADCDDSDCCNVLQCAGAPVCEDVEYEICYNGVDDDGDGAVDCDDSDCYEHFACVSTAEDCSNGVDDDGDGRVDCEDPDCDFTQACTEICDNGIDDDGNDLIDCDDPDCSDSFPPCLPENCTNGIDDNENGFTDCDDDECAEQQVCAVELCQNETDENLNGLIDCLDPMCFDTAWCGECNPYDHTGCEDGYTCYVDKIQEYRAMCSDNQGSAAEGEACAYPSQCAPGLYCTNGGANSECVKICYPGVEDSCPVEAPCTAFYGWVGNTAWGICWPY